MISELTVISGRDKSGNDENFTELTLEAGETISIVGPTGSGKTALITDIELLAQGDTATKRRILIDQKVPDEAIRYNPALKPIAMITQNTKCFADLPVWEFLQIHARARGIQDPGIIADTIEVANIFTGEKITENYKVTTLSGGQTRSLLIADAILIGAAPIILLDEIGRGTSTYDGISIAWSIAEFLHQSEHRPKTLFATHYHELNELENKLPRVRNFHITNKEVGNKVIFLRKLAPGGSTHSFGIHVAKMAGMPPALINRANEILKQLEDQRSSGDIKESLRQLPAQKMQLNIFDVHSQTFDEIRTMLEGIDINRLTPVEALLKLQEIKQRLN